MSALPNFLVVGAEKAGTTTLADMLGRHPDAFMCDPKEPRFFSYHNWDKGLEWYRSLFGDASGHLAIGEASAVYTWAPSDPEIPQRIHETLGDIRYVYVVREPVARAVSHYRHALFHRWIPDGTTFEAALDIVPALRNCSRYAMQMERYAELTKREQWHIVVLEELVADHEPVFADLCRFLGIDPAVDIDLAAANVTDQKRRPPAAASRLRGLRRRLPKPAADLGRRVVGRLGRRIERPDLDGETRGALAAQLHPEVGRFSEFVGRDLSRVWQLDSGR